MGHPIGMAYDVLHSQDSAPRVTKHRDRVECEVASHTVQVIDLRIDADLDGLHAFGGSPATPLVVVDESERVGESVQLGTKVVVVEAGATVEDDDRPSLADGSVVQAGVVREDVPLEPHGG